MNVFVDRHWNNNDEEILELLKEKFPFCYSKTREFLSDKQFKKVFMPHYHYCFLKDLDCNIKAVIAWYLYDEVFKAHPEEENKNCTYPEFYKKMVFVSLVEVADEYRGQGIGIELFDYVQERCFNKTVLLTAKDDSVLYGYYLKTGRFERTEGGERDLFFIPEKQE